MQFKTVKVRFKSILRDDVNYRPLERTIKDANYLIKIGSLFIKAFILHCIDNRYDIGHIDTSFIRKAFSVLTVNKEDKKRGRPFNGVDDVFIKLQRFFDEQFTVYTGIDTISATNMSYILNEVYSNMYEEITNHILLNYDKMIWKYIKISNPNVGKRLSAKEHTRQLIEFKNKILNNEYYEDTPENDTINYKIYWYNKILLPSNYVHKKFEVDVKTNNFKYLDCIHTINCFLQRNAVKSYNLLPLRLKSYDNYIKINTNALIEIFYRDNRNIFGEHIILYYYKLSGNIEFQEQLWNRIFKFKNNSSNYKYKFNRHSFNYEISTDGFAVSLNFINNNDIQKKETKKQNFSKCRKITNELKKSNPTDYKRLLEEKKLKKITIDVKQKEIEKERLKAKRLAFNKLSEEEKEKLRFEANTKREFPYVDTILKCKTGYTRKQIEKAFTDNKVIYIDPGKRSIFYIMGPNKPKIKELKLQGLSVHISKDKKFIDYTSKTRRMHLKTNEYETKRLIWKKTPFRTPYKTLDIIEGELSMYNSKTCDLIDFYKFINKKVECMDVIKNFYNTTYLQKLQWYAYLNKIHHENELMDFIVNEFGSDMIIVIGDWSNKGVVRYMSTPNLSLKRKLKERFSRVYHIDEFLTSRIHNVHHVKCKNLMSQSEIEKYEYKYTKTKNVKFKKLYDKLKEKLKSNLALNRKFKVHSVLTFKIVSTEMENLNKLVNGKGEEIKKENSGGCINRDKNSVFNMQTILKSLIDTGIRPEIFKR